MIFAHGGRRQAAGSHTWWCLEPLPSQTMPTPVSLWSSKCVRRVGFAVAVAFIAASCGDSSTASPAGAGQEAFHPTMTELQMAEGCSTETGIYVWAGEPWDGAEMICSGGNWIAADTFSSGNYDSPPPEAAPQGGGDGSLWGSAESACGRYNGDIARALNLANAAAQVGKAAFTGVCDFMSGETIVASFSFWSSSSPSSMPGADTHQVSVPDADRAEVYTVGSVDGDVVVAGYAQRGSVAVDVALYGSLVGEVDLGEMSNALAMAVQAIGVS